MTRKIERIEKMIRGYKERAGTDYRLYGIVQELTEVVKAQGKVITDLRKENKMRNQSQAGEVDEPEFQDCVEGGYFADETDGTWVTEESE